VCRGRDRSGKAIEKKQGGEHGNVQKKGTPRPQDSIPLQKGGCAGVLCFEASPLGKKGKAVGTKPTEEKVDQQLKNHFSFAALLNHGKEGGALTQPRRRKSFRERISVTKIGNE